MAEQLSREQFDEAVRWLHVTHAETYADGHVTTMERYAEGQYARAAAAETQVDRVRNIHFSEMNTFEPDVPAHPMCAECLEDYPCATVIALDSPADDSELACGAYQPGAPAGHKPYLCSEDPGHDGDHRAVLDGRLLASWPKGGIGNDPDNQESSNA